MSPEGGDGLELLVAAGDPSFADALVEGCEAAGDTVTAVPVTPDPDTGSASESEPAETLLQRSARNGVDGVVVGDELEAPATVIDQLSAETDLPVVLLSEAAETVAAAADAGVTDVFPRVTTPHQCDLIVDRVAAEQPASDGEPRAVARRAYREVFENVSDGLVVHDAETGEIVDVNERFCEMNGYDRETLVGSDIGLVTPPGETYSYEAARERIDRARREGPQLFEWRNQRRDGKEFPVEVHLAVVQLDGTEHVLASVRDISERKARERDLEQQRQLYSTLVEQSPNGVLIVQDKEVRFVNPQMETLTGWTEEELLERPLLELIAPEYRELVERRYEQRTRGEEPPRNYEIEIRTASDDRRIIDLHVSRIEYRGAPATLATFNDVTELRRREQELRESEQRFRTIAERVEEIIYLANADLTEVEYVNSAYADIYGRPVAELDEDPRAFLEAVHPDDREGYEADLEAMLADIEAGDPADRYEFEFRITRPDGEVRWLEATGYPILDERDAPQQFVSVVKDVTERHRRERTLETFHEATRELTTAESREAACQQAVDAAEDVLGFPLVSTHLYDEDRGRLDPVAMTSRLADLDVTLPAFGPGESLPWQVFVDGEPVTNSDQSLAAYGPGVPSPDVVLPLGSHGVMLVGGPEDTFDAADVELAQILAATLEAALNHVADERELEAREAELRRQQERADQFEALNAIIRDIERATVDQDSRSGIEEAVCERLIDVDPPTHVWTAEPEVGGDGLIPRASAGDHDAYLDALDLAAGTSAGGHPALEAYRTEEARVVQNVATDVTGGDWRRRALTSGIQSVLAVPIRYETTVHGILTLESDEPGVFDEATREVLDELGRSIGYAITVTERERALESEGTTELEFSVADEGLFMVRGAATADCRVALERTVRRTGGSFSTFYAVEGADPDDLVGLANAAASVESAQVVSTPDDDASGLIEVTAPTWFGSVFTEYGAVVREGVVEGGTGSLVVEAPRGTDIRALVEQFQERYPETELVAQRQRERTIRSLFELQDALQAELTDRQWEALETAYSAGYFEWPREVSGEDVADLLGVTQPTFNKHLRVAERVAFRLLLDREYAISDA